MDSFALSYHDLINSWLSNLYARTLANDGNFVAFILHINTYVVLTPGIKILLSRNSLILPINPKWNSSLIHIEIYCDHRPWQYPLISIIFIIFLTVCACHAIFAIEPTGKLSLSIISTKIFELFCDANADTAIFVVLFAEFNRDLVSTFSHWHDCLNRVIAIAFPARISNFPQILRDLQIWTFFLWIEEMVLIWNRRFISNLSHNLLFDFWRSLLLDLLR